MQEKIIITEIMVCHDFSPNQIVKLSNGNVAGVSKELNIGDESPTEGVTWSDSPRERELTWYEKRDQDWSRHMC
jgi:hypothetical protein